MSKKIGKTLITGGAGFVGSHLVEALITIMDEEDIVVADALRMGTMNNLSFVKSGWVKLLNTDITDYDLLSQIICKHSIDTVVHLATLPLVYSVCEPVVAFDQIVAMQQSLLECQRKGMFRRLISFSTSEVYGGLSSEEPITEDTSPSPRTPYAAAKAAADMLALSYVNSYGLDVTIVRPFNNYGARKKVMKGAGIIPTTISRLSSGLSVPLYGGGSATRDFVYVLDTAQAVIRLLQSEESFAGEIFHVATQKSISMRDVVLDIAKIMGVEPLIEERPPRQGDVLHLLGSGEKTKCLLGFQPASNWHEGLKSCVDYYSKKQPS